MTLSDQEKAAVKAAMAGDQKAFETVVCRLARIVYAQSFSILHDREEAEDVTQESFLRAYRYRVKLQDPERFPQWLLTIARNVARDRLRKHRPRRDDGDRVRMLADNRFGSPLAWAEVADDVTRLNRAMAALPEHYREAVRLRYIEGLDHRTMRRRMCLPEGVLRGVLGRAMRRLRTLMEVT